jgi:hypothetical protein
MVVCFHSLWVVNLRGWGDHVHHHDTGDVLTVGCRLVVVGDGVTKKKDTLVSYITGQYPRDYVATVFDNYAVTVM